MRRARVEGEQDVGKIMPGTDWGMHALDVLRTARVEGCTRLEKNGTSAFHIFRFSGISDAPVCFLKNCAILEPDVSGKQFSAKSEYASILHTPCNGHRAIYLAVTR